MKRILLIIGVLCNVQISIAEQWVDITEHYLVNPDYEYDTKDGWTWNASAGSTNTSYGCQEFWNGTFDMSQTVTGLSNGKYRIKVQGYYRTGDATYNAYSNYVNGTEVIPAYLYANYAQTAMTSIYAQSHNYGYPGTTTKYNNNYTNSCTMPNTMESASCYFDAGYYWNELVTEVTDGTLTLGIYNNTYVSSNWCIFSHWRLEYYTNPVYLSSLSFKEQELSLGRGEVYTLVPQMLPALTASSLINLQWSSSNTKVVIVNKGEVRAMSNGTAVVTCLDAESGLSAQVNITVESTEMSGNNIIINEIQVSNLDQFIDPSWNYGGWVELYNPSEKSVYLGNAIIRDHKGRSFRLPADYGSIPAHGFSNIWFDHNSRYGTAYKQVDFKLDTDGGTIIICNPNGVELVRQTYPTAVGRVSYARTTDGGSTWAMTGDATPAASNEGSQWASEQLQAPTISATGCFFSGTKTFDVTVPAGCTLVYTTDGSTPTKAVGEQYVNSSTTDVTRTFSLSQTGMYRFRLCQDGYLPSEVETRSFLRLDVGSYPMPVVSVVANPDDLFGSEYGVYVRGNGNGRPGNGQATPCNWNMDWERAVNFEYLLPTGEGSGDVESVFNQLVDFEMCGGWSRAWEPHSFKLKANKAYGAKYLDYTFFEDKPFNRNKVLQLRNGGNDTNCRIKDAALQEMVRRSGLYLDGQAWQPVHVFINGVYRKALNIREPNNKHFALANYGIDTDYIDQFEISPDSGYVQKSGTKDAFLRWYELSKSCTDDQVYQLICDSLVDIEEYINYMAVEFYLGATDWPQNNVKGFRALEDDDNGHPVGKFHFVLFDLDGTFATNTPFTTFANKQIYTFDQLYGIDEYGEDITGLHYTEEIEFVTIFLNMLNNERFRQQFIDTYCLVAGSVFEPNRCYDIIAQVQQSMNEVLAVEGGSSDNTAYTLMYKLSSSYQTAMVSHLQEYLGLSAGRQVTLSSNVEAARLLLNGQEVPTGRFSGTLFGNPQLQAIAPAGYRFVGWSKTGTGAQSTVFNQGTEWHYYDSGSLDYTGWKQDMSSRSKGHAPLGYGKSQSTTLQSGRPTYYFGREFELTSDMLLNELILDFVVDDGFVVYVNGVEAGRYNMPTGTISYSTYASTYAPNNPDSGTMTLSRDLFRSGSNTICVEVHNNNATSSDIYWDAGLYYLAPTASDIVSTDSIYTLGSGNMSLVACFAEVPSTMAAGALAFPIKVNEIGAANDIYVNEYWKKNDWIELYNMTDYDLDVAGLYVSDNLNKPQKYQIVGTFANQTIIPARGYLVVWADKLASATQLHTGFKLANEDAVVTVHSSEEFETNNATYFAAHPEMSGFGDVLTYTAHLYNQSVGRYPDGGNAIYLMQGPSIGGTNRHLLSDELYGTDMGLSADQTLAIEELTPEDDLLENKDGMMDLFNHIYYDLQGRRVTCPQGGQLVIRAQHP